jgi:alkylation response protein AidB-like acyl-CoA dehydrogenase
MFGLENDWVWLSFQGISRWMPLRFMRTSAHCPPRSRRSAGNANSAASLSPRTRDAGLLLTGVQIEYGGIWQSLRQSARPICEMLRILAHGDSSVALVCAMHPVVLNFWMATAQAPPPFDKAWEEQRRSIFRRVCEGAWWGTIASEPGVGGDISKTRATARRGPSDGTYLLTGQKNFGSGSGITSYMITVAVPEGETAPDMFVLDLREAEWDGSSGVTLTAPWDGHGMAATQSHAFSFEEFPVTRMAWPGQFSRLAEAAGGARSMLLYRGYRRSGGSRSRDGAPAGGAASGRSARFRASGMVKSRTGGLADPAGL